MNETLEIEGQWWINGPKSDAHYGVLSFDPEIGLILSVKIPQDGGGAEALKIWSNDRAYIPRTIPGKDAKNHSVSLLGCSATNFKSEGGLRSYIIYASKCLRGQTYLEWNDITSRNLGVDYSLLHNWLNISNINWNPDQSFSINKQKPTEIIIEGNIKLTIWPTYSVNHSNTGINLIEGHSVNFEFPKLIKVKDSLSKYAESFRRFLTLLTNHTVFIDNLDFHPKNDKSSRKVILLEKNPGVTNAKRKLMSFQMLVNYHDIRYQFSEIINKWFQLENSLSDVLNLYFATIFTPELYAHQKFLFLAQALEVYHRSNLKFENQAQPKAIFRARKNNIIEKVPEEKSWLTEKLGHANEKSLAQRLGEILELHKQEVTKFIDKPKEFSDSIRHTRNHFTHYGTSENHMNKVAQGIDLVSLTSKMNTLLQLCIFSDLGISGAPIDHLIEEQNKREYYEL